MRCAAQALRAAGIEKEANPEAHGKLDKKRVGVIVGSGMGGLTVFQVRARSVVWGRLQGAGVVMSSSECRRGCGVGRPHRAPGVGARAR